MTYWSWWSDSGLINIAILMISYLRKIRPRLVVIVILKVGTPKVRTLRTIVSPNYLHHGIDRFGTDLGGLRQLNTATVCQSVQCPRHRIRISSPIECARWRTLLPIAGGSRRVIPTLARKHIVTIFLPIARRNS